MKLPRHASINIYQCGRKKISHCFSSPNLEEFGLVNSLCTEFCYGLTSITLTSLFCFAFSKKTAELISWDIQVRRKGHLEEHSRIEWQCSAGHDVVNYIMFSTSLAVCLPLWRTKSFHISKVRTSGQVDKLVHNKSIAISCLLK